VIPPGYQIARARPGDLSLLPAIERAAAQLLRGHAPEYVLNEVTECDTLANAARDGLLWVALAGDAPVGFALVEMLADDLPHLDEVDVEPSHGRRGLGTALVRAVCEWATASGFSMLTLTTFRAVPWNLPFYARLGFVEIPRDLLRPELAAVVSNEAARGLAPETRAVMAYRPMSLRAKGTPPTSNAVLSTEGLSPRSSQAERQRRSMYPVGQMCKMQQISSTPSMLDSVRA
jgi:GNAT superfamily N-acetyltransferase